MRNDNAKMPDRERPEPAVPADVIADLQAENAALKADALLWRRICNWLDCEEGRQVTLVNANPDFDGPSHIMEYSVNWCDDIGVRGETREECFAKVEAATQKKPD